MNIAILSTSSRAHSNTARVGKAIEHYFENHPEKHLIFRPDFTQYDIPFFNEAYLDPQKLSSFQQEVVDALTQSQLVFFLSPEYNWFPSAEAVNLLHQLGNRKFMSCWENKTWATVGISSGRGGRIPSVQLGYVLNKIIGHLGAFSQVSAKNFESQFTPHVLDEQGLSLGNQEYDQGLESFLVYNYELAKKLG